MSPPALPSDAAAPHLPRVLGPRLLRSPVPELALAATAAAVLWDAGPSLGSGYRLALAATLLLVALSDAATMTIPLRLLVAGTTLSLGWQLHAVGPAAAGAALAAGLAAASAVAAAGWAAGALAGRPALGTADVLLVGMLGVVLGPAATLETVVLGAAGGLALLVGRSVPEAGRSAAGATLLLALAVAVALGRELELGVLLMLLAFTRTHRTGMSQPVPFGACLAAAALPRVLA